MKELGCKVGETSEDGIFTLSEFECLGACVNAPIIWVDDDYYEDLDPENTRKLIQALRKGKSQNLELRSAISQPRQED